MLAENQPPSKRFERKRNGCCEAIVAVVENIFYFKASGCTPPLFPFFLDGILEEYLSNDGCLISRRTDLARDETQIQNDLPEVGCNLEGTLGTAPPHPLRSLFSPTPGRHTTLNLKLVVSTPTASIGRLCESACNREYFASSMHKATCIRLANIDLALDIRFSGKIICNISRLRNFDSTPDESSIQYHE